MRHIKYVIKGMPLITLGWITGILLGCCTIGGISLLSPGIVRAASPTWSPDGQNLAFECYYENPILKDVEQYSQTLGADICTISRDGRNLRRLTKAPGADRHPVWSPDGSQIAYVRENGLYVISADGTNRRWLVKGANLYPTWSPDGKYLLFSTQRDIYRIAVADGRVKNLTADLSTDDHSPEWILHGQKIVFVSTDWHGFSQELKMMNPDGSGKQVIQEKIYFCGSISVSDEGQIALIDKSPPTFSCGEGHIIELDEEQPVQRFKSSSGIFTWSCAGRYLVYDGTTGVEVLDTKTGKTQSLELPAHQILDQYLDWSPDDQLIAITLREVGLMESWTFNIHYGLIEAWPENTHIYIIDVERNTMRPLI